MICPSINKQITTRVWTLVSFNLIINARQIYILARKNDAERWDEVSMKDNVADFEMFKKNKEFYEQLGDGYFFALKCEDGTVIYKQLSYEEMIDNSVKIKQFDRLKYVDQKGNEHFIVDIYMPIGLKFISLKTGEDAE